MYSNQTTSEQKQYRRQSILRDFALNTSTHALPNIVRAESKHNCIFWSISFICFIGIMIYFIVTAVIAYFQYPTNMDLSYEDEWPQSFPAFSLCNLASLRFDQFIEPFVNFTNARNWTNTNDTTTISPFQTQFIWQFLIDTINRNESMVPYGFSLSSMLHTCSYNYVPCSAADFISFMSPTYGLCHTFNAKLKNNTDDSVRNVNKNGGSGLLSLGLYVHSHQYIPYTIDAVGVLVLVHDNTQLPFIEASGIELSPGKRHKLSYRKKATKFLSSPYTTCTNQLSPSMMALIDSYSSADYAYSVAICYLLCEQAYVYEKCGCISQYLWNARSITLPGTNKVIVAPLCNENDPCHVIALASLVNNTLLMKNYCSSCSQECSVTNFMVQVSSSNGPLDWQMDSIKEFVKYSSVPLPVDWMNTWREDIKHNYLSINVLCETNIVETNTQSAVMRAVDVISNIGGQTGLWLGLSFLSIMEFIEAIYRLIRYQLHLTLR